MTYTTLDQYNTSEGLHTLGSYAFDIVPILPSLILFAVFTIACLGSFFASMNLGRKADFPASFGAAAIFTAIVCQLMALLNWATVPMLATCYGLAIAGVVWIFFSREQF